MLCSVSNVMRLDYVESSPPIIDNSAFCFTGPVCKTSKANMAHGDWAKSSTME